MGLKAVGDVAEEKEFRDPGLHAGPSLIRIRYFAAAADKTGCADDDVDVGAAVSVRELRLLLGARHPALVPVLVQSRLAVNLRFASEDEIVVDGSEVAVVPPVAGG